MNMTKQIQNYTGSYKAHKIHRHISYINDFELNFDTFFDGMRNSVFDGTLLKFTNKIFEHCKGKKIKKIFY